MKRIISLMLCLGFVFCLCGSTLAVDDPMTFIEGVVTRTSAEKHSATRGDDAYGSIDLNVLIPSGGATGATFRGKWNGYNVTPAMTFIYGQGPSYQPYTYSSRTGFGPGSTVNLYGSTPDANNGTTAYRGDWTR